MKSMKNHFRLLRGRRRFFEAFFIGLLSTIPLMAQQSDPIESRPTPLFHYHGWRLQSDSATPRHPEKI